MNNNVAAILRSLASLDKGATAPAPAIGHHAGFMQGSGPEVQAYLDQALILGLVKTSQNKLTKGTEWALTAAGRKAAKGL